MRKMRELTRKQAVELYESGFWEPLSYEERAKFQMLNELLCMPFEVFHEAIEKYLGRPVWTHEFGLNREGLMEEVFAGAAPPSLEEIIDLIPKEKRLIVGC